MERKNILISKKNKNKTFHLALFSFLFLFSISFAVAQWDNNLNDGLVAYHSFDNASGNTTLYNDVNNSVNNGTFVTGTPNYTSNSLLGNAVDFSGVNDEVFRMPYSMNSTEGTMSFWYKPFSNSTDEHFLGGNTGGNNPGDFYFRIQSAGQDLDWVIESGVATTFTRASGYFNGTDKWYHVVVTWNSTEHALYVNAVKEGTQNTTLESPSFNNWRIGGREPTDESNSSIDEFSYYNRTLTPTEIAQVYNSGNGVTFAERFIPTNADIITDFGSVLLIIFLLIGVVSGIARGVKVK